VGSIEPGFMKLNLVGKVDGNDVDDMISGLDLQDVSGIERSAEVVCIKNRLWCFSILIN